MSTERPRSHERPSPSRRPTADVTVAGTCKPGVDPAVRMIGSAATVSVMTVNAGQVAVPTASGDPLRPQSMLSAARVNSAMVPSVSRRRTTVSSPQSAIGPSNAILSLSPARNVAGAGLCDRITRASRDVGAGAPGAGAGDAGMVTGALNPNALPPVAVAR